MRLLILTAGAVLTVSACSSNSGNNAANADMNAVDMNASTDMNMSAGSNMAVDENAAMTNGAAGADGNMATNSATENELMQKDQKTHDHDTNLANGI